MHYNHIVISQTLTPSSTWLSAFREYQYVQDATQVRFETTDMIWLHDAYPNAINQVAQWRAQGIKVVVMSLQPQASQALTFLQAGAVGYCHALASAELLMHVIDSVYSGSVWLGVELMQQMVQALAPPVDTTMTLAQLDRLSAKEKETVHWVVQGLSNKEVARHMSITERTVKAHLASVFEKLQVKDRIQLTLRLTSN